jgi:hypothetical protein
MLLKWDVDADGLRAIRTTLDEPAFLVELNNYLRGVNDPDERAGTLSDIIAISRICSDRSAERKNTLTNVRYGIGGGIAMTASGIVGMATGGAALIIVVFAGAWLAGMSALRTSPLSAEEQIYSDIAARATKIREKFDVV